MIHIIVAWFQDRKINSRRQKISKLYKTYVEMQRKGKLDEAGKAMKEIESLEDQIKEMQNG